MKIELVVSAAFLLAASVVVARSTVDNELKDTFQSRYAEMKAAMAARDPKAIASLLAPGFVSEDVSGKTQTAESMIGELQALPRDTKKVSETTVEAASIDGDTATVSQRYHMTTVKIAQDGSSKAVELTTISTDTWTKIDGAWLLKRTVTMRLDYSVDGRVIAHKEHATPGERHSSAN